MSARTASSLLSARLDKHWPRRGPCAFCGYADARHRIFEAIHGRRRAGESIESLMQDYDASAEAIVLALEWSEPIPTALTATMAATEIGHDTIEDRGFTERLEKP